MDLDGFKTRPSLKHTPSPSVIGEDREPGCLVFARNAYLSYLLHAHSIHPDLIHYLQGQQNQPTTRVECGFRPKETDTAERNPNSVAQLVDSPEPPIR